jgi:opine dehydrogenase
MKPHQAIKVAICGAGRGGMTEAADLTLMGHSVRLFELPRFSKNIEAIKARGGIAIKGQTASGKTGTVMPAVVTSDPAEALEGAEVIMITCPVFGHQAFMDMLSPHFQEGQVVVFNTGYWSSLRFQSQIISSGANVILAETMLLPYLTFTDGPASVNVYATKQEVFFAAMPAIQTDLVLPKLQLLYPQFTKVANVLETNLKNINPIAHAPISLLNAGTIENLTGQPFYFYRDGATQRVCQVAEVLDQERVALCAALDVSTMTMLEQMATMYGHVGAEGDSLYEAFKGNEADQEFAFDPADILLEVAREDVPYGLMPLAALARQLDIPTPTIDAIIHLQTLVSGEDFQLQGLSLDDLGLAGMSSAQIRAYVESGD